METADKNSLSTKVKTSKECKKGDDNRLSHKQDIKLLLFMNNRMPIISDVDRTENCDNKANRLQYMSPKTRLVLLAVTTILSVVSAMCFLLGLRFSYPNDRERQMGPETISCIKSLTNPLENFFGYDVSFLIWCNQKLGIFLAIMTSALINTAVYLRHPFIHKTKDKGISRNNLLRINLVLLIIAMFACINLILLACYDLYTWPHHIIFACGCFGSFIVYQLVHNCCLMNDILRNRTFTWKKQSNENFQHRYVMFTCLALMFGVISSLLTLSGCILRLGVYRTKYGIGYGARFQWMAIISILGYFLPVYLLIVIRDYLLYHQL